MTKVVLPLCHPSKSIAKTHARLHTKLRIAHLELITSLLKNTAYLGQCDIQVIPELDGICCPGPEALYIH